MFKAEMSSYNIIGWVCLCVCVYVFQKEGHSYSICNQVCNMFVCVFVYLRRCVVSRIDWSIDCLPHIGPSPSRSPGRNELSEEGVVRCWSPPSMVGAPQSDEALVGADHSWLLPLPELPPQVSGGGLVGWAPGCATPEPLWPELELGPEPGRMLPQPPAFGPCDWDICSCVIRLCTSESAGDSAKMVVFPRTQLFKAPWAWNVTNFCRLISAQPQVMVLKQEWSISNIICWKLTVIWH